MAEAGFEEIRTYVMKRQNIVAHYIATQPILNLCERSDWRPGAWVSWLWWEQDGLDLEGAKEISEAESDREEAQSKEEGLAQEEKNVQE